MPKDARKKTASAPRLAAVALAVIIITAAVLFSADNSKKPAISSCGPYRNDKTVHIGSTLIRAEVAATPAAQQQGLGGRPCIEPNRGMLFAFSHSGHYAFWMKDMQFPIDIIWIDADHKVVALKENVSPSTYPNRFVNQNEFAQYVLELPAHRSESLNIKFGTAVNF